MELLKELLEQRIELTQEDWSLIDSKVNVIKVKRGQELTRHGEVESKLYFVNDGILRLYHEREDRDITVNFGFPSDFISSYSSFLTGEESIFSLETLSDCSLIEIDKLALESIYKESKCGHEVGRMFAEELFVYMSRRETSFMLRSPTERYLDLFNQQPQLIKEIPLKYLASYIGITPQALSRIRAKI